MVKNNYSSGRNDDRLLNPNGKNEPQAFVDASEEGEQVTDVLPCHPYSAVGQMNLNSMLIENIRSHDYFKGLAELRTFEEVVDQIYYDVSYVTPWKPGTHKTQRAAGMCSGLRGVSNAGQPSTAYMLLMKMYTLHLTKSQIRRLLDHTDSPYLRALGFLYLRYVCDPKTLFSWCEKYLDDEEKLSPQGDQSQQTIGVWLRGLLTDLEYYDTMLPRLPVPVVRELAEKFKERDAESGGAGGGGGGSSTRRDERDGRDGRDRCGLCVLPFHPPFTRPVDPRGLMGAPSSHRYRCAPRRAWRDRSPRAPPPPASSGHRSSRAPHPADVAGTSAAERSSAETSAAGTSAAGTSAAGTSASASMSGPTIVISTPRTGGATHGGMTAGATTTAGAMAGATSGVMSDRTSGATSGVTSGAMSGAMTDLMSGATTAAMRGATSGVEAHLSMRMAGPPIAP